MFSPALYSDYFCHLAKVHPLILHDEEAGKIAFAEDSFEDFFDGQFKTALKSEGFCMRLIDAIVSPDTDEAANYLTRVQCGFSILKYTTAWEIKKIRLAHDETYVIARQIIARLIHDSRINNPLFEGSLNQLSYANWSLEKVFFDGDGQWHGYIVTFNFKSTFIEDLKESIDTTNWTDLPPI